MSTLTGREPKDTYKDLLKVENAQGGLDTTPVTVETGNGDQSTLQLGTTSLKINGITYPTSDGASGQAIVTDGAGTASFATVSVSTEEIQDIVGAMFTGNTETGVTVTYQDADGTIDVEVGIGSSVQAYSANLDSWSAVAPSSYLTTASAASTYLTIATASSTYQPLSSNLTDWSGEAVADYSNTAAIAAAYQPLDADLTSIAALGSAADKMLYTTGISTWAEAALTSFGRSLIDDSDAATARTTLGLGTLATQSGTFSGTSSGTNTGDQNIFQTIAISGQDDVVADSTADTLTFVAGANMTITTSAAGDSVTFASSGGGLSDADYGDITVGGSGTTMTIDNAAVTYAKIQNVSATDLILGRSTAGAGTIEEIACTAAGRALLDDASASDQRTTLGLGTLATQSGTFSGTSSGTNTGDQTISLTGQVTGSGTGSFTATLDKTAITDQTADASPDSANDYILTYDASATSLKKVLLSNLPGGSSSLPDWVSIGTTTASSSASIIFTGLTSYKEYVFHFEDIRPATDGTGFLMYLSVDNGSTYVTGSLHGTAKGSSSITVQSGDDYALITVTTISQGNQVGEVLTGSTHLIRNTNGVNYAQLRSWSSYGLTSGSASGSNGDALLRNTSDVDAVKFQYASGNITSGTIRVFGR